MNDIIYKLSSLKIKDEIKSVTMLQRLWRGYRVRRYNQQMKDNMTGSIVKTLLDNYIKNLLFIDDVNKMLSKKKVPK